MPDQKDCFIAHFYLNQIFLERIKNLFAEINDQEVLENVLEEMSFTAKDYSAVTDDPRHLRFFSWHNLQTRY